MLARTHRWNERKRPPFAVGVKPLARSRPVNEIYRFAIGSRLRTFACLLKSVANRAGEAVKAQCQCGQLVVGLPERPLFTIACHCLDCQRRTGAPFGVLAYYRADQISIEGIAKPYKRTSAEGNAVETFFCSDCGSTVYLKLAKQPALVGIAVGSIGDPTFPAPAWSVWEQSKHHWIDLPGEIEHFVQGN